MAVNKIVLNTDDGEQVLVDLTGDSVTPETLAEGVTAHGANGEPIVGTMRSAEDLNSVLTEQEELIAELRVTLRNKTQASQSSPQLLNSILDGTVETFDSDDVASVKSYSFQSCARLTKVSFSNLSDLGSCVFRYDSRLVTVIIRTPTVCVLRSANSFTSTPIESGTGYIYVPAFLVDSYKTATNWSTYSAQFRAIEDYPEICGGE